MSRETRKTHRGEAYWRFVPAPRSGQGRTHRLWVAPVCSRAPRPEAPAMEAIASEWPRPSKRTRLIGLAPTSN